MGIVVSGSYHFLEQVWQSIHDIFDIWLGGIMPILHRGRLELSWGCWSWYSCSNMNLDLLRLFWSHLRTICFPFLHSPVSIFMRKSKSSSTVLWEQLESTSWTKSPQISFCKSSPIRTFTHIDISILKRSHTSFCSGGHLDGHLGRHWYRPWVGLRVYEPVSRNRLMAFRTVV